MSINNPLGQVEGKKKSFIGNFALAIHPSHRLPPTVIGKKNYQVNFG